MQNGKKKIKPYSGYKDDKEFWSQQYGRPVSDEEAREIKDNFMRLVELLKEIDRDKKGD